MANDKTDRRSMMLDMTAMTALLGLGSAAGAAAPAAASAPAPAPYPLDYRGKGKIPWFKRVFHLYTGGDGLTRIERLPTNAPLAAEAAQFLRRNAQRVTISGTSAGAGFDFHVANQPTLMVPLFGSMIIGLADGSRHELRHGDIAYAEDCTGKGHISRSGPQGSFMITIQMPKPLCPVSGSSDHSKLWTE